MKSIELAMEYLAANNYRIVSHDDSHIIFRYRMNTLCFWKNDSDEHFFVLMLPRLDEVTGENRRHVSELCMKVNAGIKQVKLYLLDDAVMAAAELYSMAADDFAFQFGRALQNLVAAKVMYRKMDNDEM